MSLPRTLLLLASPALAAAQTPRLELVSELTVGQADGPPEYAFGRLGGMTIRRNGSFFLYDYADSQLRRYDAAGRFQGLVGRGGAGPGEYRDPMGLAMHGDSLLLVYDPGNGRITLFDTAGRYRRGIPFQRAGFFGDKAFAADREGLLYVRTSRLAGDRQEGAAVPTQFVRLRLDGGAVDSIPLPIESTEGWPFVLITADGARYSFPERTVYELLPDGGLATGDNASYRITLTPAAGGAARVIERPHTRLPVAGAERAEWQAWSDYFASRPQATRRSVIPDLKPVFRDLLVDRDDRLWVHLYTTATKRNIPPRPAGDRRPLLTIREPNVYDLFTLEGRYLGRVTLPPQSLLLGVAGERIWVRSEAEAGEYILTRYRINGLAR